MPGSFFDSNVLLYLVSEDLAKAQRAERILERGGTISVQVLNEVANVMRRKGRRSWNDTHRLLNAIKGVLKIIPVTVDIHRQGLTLAERYGFATYDAMIVAAALIEDCDTLWSEDMQAGQLVSGQLRITNPFLA